VVYELRQRAGLTQELLAGLAGVDRSMISRYETGRRSPRLDTLQRLASAVELEVVVSFQSASPRAAAETADPGDRSVAPSDVTWTSSEQDTHNPGGGAVFTRGGEFAP
jgi:transcriptional regulator with XRE-family HTH domain